MSNDENPTMTKQTPSSTQTWIVAMRPRTLPLAVAAIILGGFLAAATGAFSWTITLLCVLTAVFLQILSNLANDYGDSIHGADSIERTGPQRAVQSGAISAESMKRAMGLFVGLSLLSGTTLLFVAFGNQAWLLLLLFGVLGGAAIWAAINYTAGGNPYGYVGLGDLFVFLFFGWVGVIGTYFLQVQRIDWLLLLPATAVGLLAVAVLNINNIRDIVSDQKAGKISIPVRLGPRRARIYHWGLLITAVLCATLYVMLTFNRLPQLLYLLMLPGLVRNGMAVWRTQEPMRINPLLKQMSLLTLLFVLLFGIGQLWG